MEAGQRFGEYVLTRRLGAGGQGEVFEARDAIGIAWALKIGHPVRTDGQAALARFVREAQWVTSTLGGLPRNCGILVGEHYGVHDNRFYVKMRLVHGESLAQQLERDHAPAVPAVVGMVARLAQIVAIAHENSAIHRDLKPENVLLEPEGGVQVVDWGCIHLVEAGRIAESGIGPLCTLGYAPPEQYELKHAPTPATDIYALGVMLFEMLTGYNPFLDSWRNAARAITSANGAGVTRTAKPVGDLSHAATGLYPTAGAQIVREGFPDAITRATAATNVMPLEECLLQVPEPPRSSFALHTTDGFRPVSVAEVLGRQLTFDIARFHALTAPLPEPLVRLLTAMLSPHANERPSSMRAITEQLDSIADKLRHQVPVVTSKPKPRGSRRRVVGILAACVAVGAAVAWRLEEPNRKAAADAAGLRANMVVSDMPTAPLVNAPLAEATPLVKVEAGESTDQPLTVPTGRDISTLERATPSLDTSPSTAAAERGQKKTSPKPSVSERPRPLATSSPAFADHPYFESQRKVSR